MNAPVKKIYVGNLSHQATEDELRAFFEEEKQCGTVASCDIITDRYTGDSRGFAFVTFEEQAGSEEAKKLDGEEFKGRKLRINEAREKSRSDRGGDRRGGGGGGAGGGRRW